MIKNSSLALKILKHAGIWLFITLPLQAFGILLIPIILVYVRYKGFPCMHGAFQDTCEFPYLFRWFDNADLYTGRDTSVYLSKFEGSFLAHYHWLAIRNPINYFGYNILGFVVGEVVKDTSFSDKEVPEGEDPSRKVGDGTGNVPGKFYREINVEVNGETISKWEYYSIRKYTFRGAIKCCRLRFGWKIGQKDIKAGEHVQFVFVISPYHSYDGI